MWYPDPDWVAVPGGTGASTLGVWRDPGTGLLVKRLVPPGPSDAARERRDPWFWRREADAADQGLVSRTPGLRGPRTRVEEDADGITLWSEPVPRQDLPGPYVAAALARFAGAELPSRAWLLTGLLGHRLERIEQRSGGWPTLARTSLADLAASLWARRGHFLTLLEGLPQVPQHGDPTPGNLRSRYDDPSGSGVLAIDWSLLGFGAVGSDLGYLALSQREDFEVLLSAYLADLPAGVATPEQARLGASVTAAYTVVSRAEWALSRVVGGEGALAGKFRHPAVAPYLRSLQRHFPQIEALL